MSIQVEVAPSLMCGEILGLLACVINRPLLPGKTGSRGRTVMTAI